MYVHHPKPCSEERARDPRSTPPPISLKKQPKIRYNNVPCPEIQGNFADKHEKQLILIFPIIVVPLIFDHLKQGRDKVETTIYTGRSMPKNMLPAPPIDNRVVQEK